MSFASSLLGVTAMVSLTMYVGVFVFSLDTGAPVAPQSICNVPGCMLASPAYCAAVRAFNTVACFSLNIMADFWVGTCIVCLWSPVQCGSNWSTSYCTWDGSNCGTSSCDNSYPICDKSYPICILCFDLKGFTSSSCCGSSTFYIGLAISYLLDNVCKKRRKIAYNSFFFLN